MSPGDYEGAFIKAGDSETRKGLAQKQQQENLGWAALAHWEVREKGALGDRFGGLAWDELLLPTALEFGRCMPVKKEVGEEEGKGNGVGCPPEGECTCWVLSPSCSWES